MAPATSVSTDGAETETPGISAAASPVADISAAEEGSLPASGASTEGTATDPATAASSVVSTLGKPPAVGDLGELCKAQKAAEKGGRGGGA